MIDVDQRTLRVFLGSVLGVAAGTLARTTLLPDRKRSTAELTEAAADAAHSAIRHLGKNEIPDALFMLVEATRLTWTARLRLGKVSDHDAETCFTGDSS